MALTKDAEADKTLDKVFNFKMTAPEHTGIARIAAQRGIKQGRHVSMASVMREAARDKIKKEASK